MAAWRMAFREGENGPEMWSKCRDLQVAAINYDPIEEIDFSDYQQGEPKDAWSQLAPSQRASLWRFVYKMQKEDVIYVKQGPRIVGKGIVEGLYKFDAEGRILAPNNSYWRQQRRVNWCPEFPEVLIQVGLQQVVTVVPLTDEDVARIERAVEQRGGGPITQTDTSPIVPAGQPASETNAAVSPAPVQMLALPAPTDRNGRLDTIKKVLEILFLAGVVGGSIYGAITWLVAHIREGR